MFDLAAVRASKRAYRSRLASLPIADKLRLLDALHARAVALREAGTGAGRWTRPVGLSIYYSVVTFTTLGYGDFQPTPNARPIAALQAFTGYIILGVLASTAATLVHPTKGPLQVEEEGN